MERSGTEMNGTEGGRRKILGIYLLQVYEYCCLYYPAGKNQEKINLQDSVAVRC